jgi:hypothetical protein
LHATQKLIINQLVAIAMVHCTKIAHQTKAEQRRVALDWGGVVRTGKYLSPMAICVVG